MSESIKGFLIDPYSRTVTEVKVEKDSDGSVLASMKKLMGCARVDCAQLGETDDDVWLDDEGLFNNYCYFRIARDNPYHIFPGKCLVLGNKNGDSVDAHTTKEYLEQEVINLTKQQAAKIAEELGI